MSFLSAVLMEGKVHCLNWNGQWRAPGETACTGTASYSVVDEVRIAEFYQEQSQYLLAYILHKFLDGRPDLKDVYGMVNMDIMIPGDKEVALWKRAQNDIHLMRFLDSHGMNNEEYAPSIYNPNRVLIAEINPRDTNWTLALKAVLQATHREFSLTNIVKLASGYETKILARDAWLLPKGVSISEARDKLLEYHTELAKDGEGFILRMPDNPAGAIVWTHGDPMKIYEKAHTALSKRT